MSRRITFAIVLLILILAVPPTYLILERNSQPSSDDLARPSVSVADQLSPPGPSNHLAGPDWQRRFFSDWHAPYGASLPPEVLADIWAQIERLPDEDPERNITEWNLMGPSGMATPENGLYSGRVLDLDFIRGPNPLVAAASGGLWKYNLFFPTALTDEITSQWTGAVAVHPQDPDIILVGTGELYGGTGTGIWKTTNGGETWHQTACYDGLKAVCRIRYGSDPNIVHAVGDPGYHRSTDGGETWIYEQFNTAVTDLALVPGDPDILYATRWDWGLFLSLDEGLIWNQATNATLPSSLVTRGAVSVCASNPAVIYVAFAHYVQGSGHPMKGIWKTTNYGFNWTNVSPPDNYMGRQGWYNNVIAVCPTNPNLVLAGGVPLLRTTNGGTSWDVVNDPHLHVDYHALQWHPNGSDVWAGHDGGWSHSTFSGEAGSWSSSGNTLPITQYVEIDASGATWWNARVAGGSQDNGLSFTLDGGQTWEHRAGGDGGGIEFGSGGSQEVYFAAGLSGDGLLFHRYFSDDNCLSWTDISDGIGNSDTWYPSIRIDASGNMFTFSGGSVYSRAPGATTWSAENLFPWNYNVLDVTVSPVPGAQVIYACMDTDSPYRVNLKDSAGWEEISADLPPNVRIRKIIPHPTNSWRAYAIINGLDTPEQKIFFTQNRGETWYNMTGNLPNVPLSDLVVYPGNDDLMVVASEFGCYRTTDHGYTWSRWNNGMPRAAVVMELKTLNMEYLGMGFHVVAGTYGRSIWRRAIDGDDPSAVPVATTLTGSLHTAPNPFNPSTTLSFELGAPSSVRLDVYNISGELVRRLTAGTLETGRHEFVWDGLTDRGQQVASGVYLVRLQVNEQAITEKVVLAK